MEQYLLAYFEPKIALFKSTGYYIAKDLFKNYKIRITASTIL